MTVRVMLVSPAMSAALREARFDDDAELDGEGRRRTEAVRGAVPGADRYLSGPSWRCRATAAALGLRATPEPALADWDTGRWRGRLLEEVSAAEPDAVSTWLTDPSAAPHGGESLIDLCGRVDGWLEEVSSGGGRVLAVVQPSVVRAALVRALALSPTVFWRLDVTALTVTELSGRAGRWNLRCGRPLTP
ncbi:histidine phosphatase family protein [Streptomyces sp. NPDC051994]|uniref:histidine phosphatase family protein n=1 Tax=unclassified Streptomyces TaxID=2593676 RepID=UPI00342DB434